MSLVISRTPFRVSFFGGGSDYPAWYLRNGGAVLSTAINKYCYITGRFLPPFFSNRHRIVWSHIETVNAIAEILHPAVRAGLPFMGFDDSRGIELHHQGDLPARTGIGSSSAFAVGLINTLSVLRGAPMTNYEIGLAAIDLEQNHLKDSVGSQDQMACACGGLNVIRFATDGRIAVEPLAIAPERKARLERGLLLFYTGADRLSSTVAKETIANLAAREAQVRRMHAMVDEAAEILRAGDIHDFGRLLDETWRLKRELAPSVSSARINDIYMTAIAAGALGGKLLGAGSSGFLLFYVPEEGQALLKRALRDFLCVPIAFDDIGTTIVYNGTD